MPIARFQMPDGRIGRFEVPEGTTPEQAQAMIAQQVSQPKPAPAPQAKPFGQQLNDVISDAPRQVGLAARYGMEGLGDTFDTFVGNPLRTLAAPVLGNKSTARTGAALADLVNLPQPRTADERVVGDATRMLAGGAGVLGAASKVAQGSTGMTKTVAGMLAAKPAQQLASAGAAGAAGGYTRETGGNESSQLLASLAAGVATPFAMSGATRVGQALRPRPAPSPVQVDITINNAIQQSGMSLDELPAQVAASIRADVAKAMQIGDNLDADAVRRLADYRLIGATPTAAALTQDPAMVTRQKNLASLGMNLKDKAAQELGQTENRNNQVLKAGLNSLGASTVDDAYAGSQKIISGVNSYDDRASGVIGKLYSKARASDGRSAALDHYTFTQKVGNLLNEANVESFLTPDIRNKINSFAKAGMPDGTPLTVEIAEQFKTSIGKLQRNSTDGNTRHALGLVRQALDDTPLQQGQEIGGGAQMAFNRARKMNRQYMAIVEKTPALQAVRDGIEPDKFVQQFIVGGGPKANVMDVAMLKSSIKKSPEAVQAVREQILAHLKSKALNGMPEETGNIGSATYVKALDSIGDRKLKLFFNADEINQMKAIGRVGRYEQFQPAGAKVNNSQTAGANGGNFARLMMNLPVVSPLVKQFLATPVQNFQVGFQSSNALNAPRALTNGIRAPQRAPRGLAMSPAAVLGTEDEETRRKRAAGLLLP